MAWIGISVVDDFTTMEFSSDFATWYDIAGKAPVTTAEPQRFDTRLGPRRALRSGGRDGARTGVVHAGTAGRRAGPGKRSSGQEPHPIRNSDRDKGDF